MSSAAGLGADGARLRTVTVATPIPAPAASVWDRIVTPEGINHELAPWLRMTVPRQGGGLELADIEPPAELGRSWLLLLGVIPFDWDDIRITELEPGRRFLEESTMFSMRRWEHERQVIPMGATCEIHDRVTFEPRPGIAWIPGVRTRLTRVLTRLFVHRQQRLAAWFEDAQPPM
ncbi:MAG: hypothetical protein R3249_02500 [Nitriliruptorales bacterium]|nr:hypothetical protein [Nitriliruptorales bacterium]